MKLKFFNIITFLIFFTLFNNISLSQNKNSQHFDKDIGIQNNGKISISLKGGINFETFGDWVTVSSRDNSLVDVPSFVSSLSLSYQLDEKQFLDLGISFVSTETNVSDNSSTVNRNFKAYPISVSYKYFTKVYPTKLRPFIGVGLSYIINRVNIKVTGDPERNGNSNLNTEGFGFELYLGLLYSFYNKINFSTEIKMNYQDKYVFTRYNIGEGGSLSLYLLFGVGYTL